MDRAAVIRPSLLLAEPVLRVDRQPLLQDPRGPALGQQVGDLVRCDGVFLGDLLGGDEDGRGRLVPGNALAAHDKGDRPDIVAEINDQRLPFPCRLVGQSLNVAMRDTCAAIDCANHTVGAGNAGARLRRARAHEERREETGCDPAH